MTVEELKVIIRAETSAFQKSINGVKSSINGLTNVVKNTTNKMTSYFTSSASKITSAFTSMGKTIAAVVSTAMLYKIGKQAIELASDLEEVQNVVDVAFGKMASEAEYFAKKCASAFGLSELSAKQFASTFMTMGNSMGLSTNAAKTMALQVAALTGDMASFYNVTQDVAYTALKSIWTGETETLKKFGVVMTETNLKAYALSQGITKSYSAMSQAEKVALRYNYVMSVTAQAQGDFTRTSSSWANQLRILQMRWQSIMSVMGGFLTQILVPIIQALNSILGLLSNVVNSFGNLFGLSKTANDMSDITKNTDGLTSSLEDADEAASSLKKTIAGFDELNVLNDTSSSTSASSLGLNFNLLEPYDFNELANQKQAEITLKKLIDDFNNYLVKIDKGFVAAREKFKELGISFANSINTIFAGINFDNAGVALGNGLNNIITLLKNFRETVDSLQIGRSIGDFFNGLFSTINWDDITTSLIARINNLFEGIFGFIDTLDTKKYSETIINFFKRIISEVKFDNISDTISGGINKAFDVAFKVVESGELKNLVVRLLNTLNDIIAKIDWTVVGKTLVNGFIQIFEALKESNFPYAAGNAIREALGSIKIKDIINSVFEGIGGAIGNLIEGLKGKEIDSTAWDKLATAFLKLSTAASILSSPLSNLLTLTRDLKLVFGGEAITKSINGIKNAFTKFASKLNSFNIGAIGDAYGGTLVKLEKLSKHGIKFFNEQDIIDGFSSGFMSWGQYFDSFTSMIKAKSKGLGASIVNTFKAIPSKIGSVFSTMGGAIKGIFTSSLAPILAIVVAVVLLIKRFVELYKNNEQFREQVQAVWGRFKEALTALWDACKPLIDVFKLLLAQLKELWTAIKPAIDSILDVVIQVILQVIDIVSSLIQTLAPVFKIIVNALKAIFEALSPIIEVIITIVSAIATFLLPIVTKVIEVVIGAVGTIAKFVIDGFGQIFNNLSTKFNNFVTVISNFATKVKNIFAGIRDFFKSVINSIIGWFERGFNGIVNKINSGGLISGINKVLGTSLQLKTISIPKLARGGIFDDPTIAMVGEASTKSNPEIVTPSNLLREIVTEGNSEFGNILIQCTKQLLTAIEGKDMNVTLDGVSIAKSVSKANNNYKLRTGTALI